ncbi:MAG TPA: hypothetical protein VF705_13310, partial [Longimicrobium sp.]
EICALLYIRVGSHPSAAELYDALPRPVHSAAAQETLRAGTAAAWFSNLEKAVAICRDLPADGLAAAE